MTDFPTQNVSSTLVFYDWKGLLNRNDWINLSLHFFYLLGKLPNSCGYISKMGKSRNVKLDYIRQNISKMDIISCTIDHLLPPFNDVNHSDVTCSFHEGIGRERTSIFSTLSNVIDVDLFVGIIQAFSQIVRITYGHAYLRPVRLGPVMYAYDLVYGLDPSRPEDVAEIEQMTRWSRERLDMITQKKLASFRHLMGMQRDVYPLNVLTEPHLSRKIGFQRLDEWIVADAKRGRLSLVEGGVWVWTVPPESLPSVQGALSDAGLLVSR